MHTGLEHHKGKNVVYCRTLSSIHEYQMQPIPRLLWEGNSTYWIAISQNIYRYPFYNKSHLPNPVKVHTTFVPLLSPRPTMPESSDLYCFHSQFGISAWFQLQTQRVGNYRVSPAMQNFFNDQDMNE